MKNIKNLKLYKGMLIVVDMVNGFVTEGALHDPKIARVIPIQIELIKEAKERGDLVTFIKDTHTPKSTEFKRFGGEAGAHCLEDSNEHELVDELLKYENDANTISINKNSVNYMEAPEFRKLIAEQTELKDVDVCGCCTDICVFTGTVSLATYFDQWNKDVNISVHEDAIATYDEENRQNYVDAAKLLMEQQGIQLVKKK